MVAGLFTMMYLSHDHLPVQYPVPWASDESISFLITSQQLHTLLQQAGFVNNQITNETAKGINSLNALLNRILQKGLPALGLHLLMGANAMEKIALSTQQPYAGARRTGGRNG